MRWMLGIVSLLIGAAAHAEVPSASKFCTGLTEATAKSSTECVRWYFACNMGVPSAVAKPPYDHMSIGDRARIMAYSTLRIAETNCDQFSYAEALAAMQAHTFNFTNQP